MLSTTILALVFWGVLPLWSARKIRRGHERNLAFLTKEAADILVGGKVTGETLTLWQAYFWFWTSRAPRYRIVVEDIDGDAEFVEGEFLFVTGALLGYLKQVDPTFVIGYRFRR